MIEANIWKFLANYAAYGEALPRLAGVELFLPLNVTSVYEPLDMEVLRFIKLNATRNMLR